VGAATRVRGGSTWALPTFAFLTKDNAATRVDCRPIREASSPPLLKNIQALRGLASILVMVMHAFGTAKDFYAFQAEHDPFIDLAHRIFLSIGPAGVDIFFVISGFIVLTVAMKSSGDNVRIFSPRTAARFYFRRLTRIYPLYWIVLVAAVTSASFVLPDRWEAIAKHPSVILLMARDYDDVPSAWTLPFELYFYSIVALGLLVASNRLLVFIAGWAVLQIAMISIAVTSGCEFESGSSIFAHPAILEFLFGCTVAVAIQRGVSHFAVPALMLGILMLFIGASLDWQRGELLRWERVVAFGGGGALLVYGLITNELHNRFVLRGLGWAGDASYSIYLWHLPVYWTANWTGMKWGIYAFMPRVMTPFVWMAFGLAIGVLSYCFVERPMLAAVRTRFQPRKTRERSIRACACESRVLGYAINFCKRLLPLPSTSIRFPSVCSPARHSSPVNGPGGDPRICQAFAASPAEPGELLFWFRSQADAPERTSGSLLWKAGPSTPPGSDGTQ
jgi:exopolysaccharide production protein ExoZ